MGHVGDAGARGVVAHEHVHAFVVVDLRVGVGENPEEIDAEMGEFGAKENALLGLEPPRGRQELVDVSPLEPLEHLGIRQHLHQFRRLMPAVRHRPEPKVLIQQRFHHGVVHRQGNMHLYRPLRMPDITHLPPCLPIHVPNTSRHIVLTHVLESELPKLLVLGLQPDVVERMFVAAAVAEPHVVPGVGEDEPRGFVGVVEDPGVGAVEETVLDEDRFEAWADGGVLLLDAEVREDVPVVGLDEVLLDRVVEVVAVLHEGQLGLGVDLGGGEQREEQQEEGQEMEMGH